jgi:biotin operon repressor
MLITAQKLALKLGISHTTVKKKLLQAGVKITKKKEILSSGVDYRIMKNYYNEAQALKALQ